MINPSEPYSVLSGYVTVKVGQPNEMDEVWNEVGKFKVRGGFQC
jgi:hypothetical protein